MTTSTFPKTMTIHVTQDDIDAGIPQEGRYCPIAIAVHRRTKGDGTLEPRVFTDGQTTEITDVRGYAEYLGPAEAIDFVGAFDDHDNVEPFSFRMTLSEAWPPATPPA
jgi:hypothetical protein